MRQTPKLVYLHLYTYLFHNDFFLLFRIIGNIFAKSMKNADESTFVKFHYIK